MIVGGTTATATGTTRSQHRRARSRQEVHLGDEMVDHGRDGHLGFARDGSGEAFHGGFETP